MVLANFANELECVNCGERFRRKSHKGPKPMYCSTDCKQRYWTRTRPWREYHRSYHLKRNFGLSTEQYKEMLDAQGGVCAICLCPETALIRGNVRRLGVDHCHATGRIRALLCAACNHGLGRFQDDPERLRAAADYLERFKS